MPLGAGRSGRRPPWTGRDRGLAAGLAGEQRFLGLVFLVGERAALVQGREALEAFDPLGLHVAGAAPAAERIEAAREDGVRELANGLPAKYLQPDEGEDRDDHERDGATGGSRGAHEEDQEQDDRQRAVRPERVVAEGGREPAAAGRSPCAG